MARYSLSYLCSFTAIALLLCETSLVAADIRPCVSSDDYQNGTYGGYPVQTFFSDPDVIAPVPNILTPPQKGVSPSKHMVWSPVGHKVEKMAARILDAHDLSLVYQGPAYDYETIGGTVQSCNGTDYLTWWSGVQHASHMAGNYYMMDMNYNLVFNFTAIGLDEGDAHEFHLTPQCTAVFTSYEPRAYSLPQYGIQDGFLLDSLFQEVDIATNTLLFQWRASDFVSLHDTNIWPSIAGQGHNINQGFDFFHINSVVKDHRGNYLVSSRHTSAVYYVDGRDGSVLWILGGKSNSFEDMSNGTATSFQWQHHAEWASDELDSISLFDNSYCDYWAPTRPSRGMLVSLDYMNRQVTLKQNYTALHDISAMREGSMQNLRDTNGNVIVGYGQEPGYTEFSADGTVLHDVRFGPLKLDRDSADNYRALKVNWTGFPTWNPRIAAGPPVQMQAEGTDCPLLPLNGSYHSLDTEVRPAKPGNSSEWELTYNNTVDNMNNTAYFSWNGATEVSDWLILASNTSTALNSTRDYWQYAPKDGFETAVRVAGAAMFVRAVAIDEDGTILGATPVLDMRDGITVEAPGIECETVVDWRAIATAEAAALVRAQRMHKASFGFVAVVLLAAALTCYFMRRNWKRISLWWSTQALRVSGSVKKGIPHKYQGVPGDSPDLGEEEKMLSSSDEDDHFGGGSQRPGRSHVH